MGFVPRIRYKPEEDEGHGYIYAPDPIELGQFVVVGSIDRGAEVFSKCQWCGSGILRTRATCEQCGGAKWQDRSSWSRVAEI